MHTYSLKISYLNNKSVGVSPKFEFPPGWPCEISIHVVFMPIRRVVVMHIQHRPTRSDAIESIR